MIDIDIISEARKLIGQAKYKFAARSFEAPDYVDCSTFVKYLYGLLGIWLPRRSIQQFCFCDKITDPSWLLPGDLIFTEGLVVNYYLNEPSEAIGHVAIFTGQDSIIQITLPSKGLGEISFQSFMETRKVRGFGRILPTDRKIITLLCPSEREVEQSDDIKWILLQSL